MKVDCSDRALETLASELIRIEQHVDRVGVLIRLLCRERKIPIEEPETQNWSKIRAALTDPSS